MTAGKYKPMTFDQGPNKGQGPLDGGAPDLHGWGLNAPDARVRAQTCLCLTRVCSHQPLCAPPQVMVIIFVQIWPWTAQSKANHVP